MPAFARHRWRVALDVQMKLTKTEDPLDTVDTGSFPSGHGPVRLIIMAAVMGAVATTILYACMFLSVPRSNLSSQIVYGLVSPGMTVGFSLVPYSNDRFIVPAFFVSIFVNWVVYSAVVFVVLWLFTLPRRRSRNMSHGSIDV